MKRYKVGYGKPSRHTQFKKGQSGNPKGRPPNKLRAGKKLEVFLQKKVEITEGGKVRRITREELPVWQWITQGLNGDVKSAELILDMYHLSKKQGDYRHVAVPIRASEARSRRITPDMTLEEIADLLPDGVSWTPEQLEKVGLPVDPGPRLTINQVIQMSSRKGK